MPTHNLFRGGLRTNNAGHTILPATDIGPEDTFDVAAHKTPALFGLSWGLAPGFHYGHRPGRNAFDSQREYFAQLETPLAVGDVINAIIVPRMSLLRTVWLANYNQIDGLEISIRLRGNSQTPAAPLSIGTFDFNDEIPNGRIVADYPRVTTTNVTIDQGTDPDVVVSSATVVPAPYTQRNDMLQLVVTAVPEDLDVCQINFAMTAVLQRFEFGDTIGRISQ